MSATDIYISFYHIYLLDADACARPLAETNEVPFELLAEVAVLQPSLGDERVRVREHAWVREDEIGRL